MPKLKKKSLSNNNSINLKKKREREAFELPDFNAEIIYKQRLTEEEEIDREYGISVDIGDWEFTLTNEKIGIGFDLFGMGLSVDTSDGGTMGIDLGVVGIELNSEGGGKISYVWDLYEIDVEKDGCSYVKDTYVGGFYSFTEVQEIPDCREEEEEEEEYSGFEEGVEHRSDGSIVVSERLDSPEDSQFDPRDFGSSCQETLVTVSGCWKMKPGQRHLGHIPIPGRTIVTLGAPDYLLVTSELAHKSSKTYQKLRNQEGYPRFYHIDVTEYNHYPVTYRLIYELDQRFYYQHSDSKEIVSVFGSFLRQPPMSPSRGDKQLKTFVG